MKYSQTIIEMIREQTREIPESPVFYVYRGIAIGWLRVGNATVSGLELDMTWRTL